MGYTLVTGATSDIGMQICRSLEENGHSLLLTDLSDDSLGTALGLLAFPDRHLTLSLDLSDQNRADEKFRTFISEKGVSVSYAVFAAGVFTVKPLRSVDYDFLKKNFDIALFSIFTLMKTLTSRRCNPEGLKSSVLISSVSAFMGTKGYTVYGSVKGAMLGLVKSLAVELAPQTRVNAVLPGGVRTRTTAFIYENRENPDPRYLLGDGEPSDIASMVEFLLSDKARWISGQEFIVDGGLTSN